VTKNLRERKKKRCDEKPETEIECLTDFDLKDPLYPVNGLPFSYLWYTFGREGHFYHLFNETYFFLDLNWQRGTSSIVPYNSLKLFFKLFSSYFLSN